MGLSIWHALLVLGLILLFFGPSRLPKLGRSIGDTMRQFKKGMNDGADDVEAERLNSGESTARKTTKKDHDRA